MVLRDKTQPKLCFDNPLYNTDGTARRHSSNPKHDPKAPPEGKMAEHKAVTALKSNASLRSWSEDMRREIFSDGNASNRASHRATMTPTTPESDFEEHIIENIRNRDFWSRRSRNNPFAHMRVSALVGGGSATPVRASTPVEFPRDGAEDAKVLEGQEQVEEEEDEPAATEMTLQLRREAELRENIAWLTTNLTEMSKGHGGKFSLSLFLSTMKNEELLRRLFSLWDLEGDGYLLQEEWIDHLKCSTREAGAREWAELLEVLAYVVCGEDGEVTEDLFTTILTSRGVLEKLFRLINKDGDGLVSREEIMDFIANLTYARPRTGFTRENLEWLEQLFRQALGHKQELSFDDFKKIVHSRNSFFAERVFQIFDRDNSGTVSLSEFLDAMHQFAGKSPNDKIKFLFKVYDLDGDGLIQQSELQKVMKACMEENGMKFSDEQIEDLTLALFEDADTQRTGAITYESLKAQLEKHDGLLENLSISIDRWLVPPNIRTEKESFWKRMAKLRPYQITLPYLKNNYVYLVFLWSYLILNLGLAISRAHEFRHSNAYTIIARACGQCLNFNCMFVLVLMLRQCITYLRSLGASSFLPLDQHLYLHKLCGWVIFILSIIHTIAHLLNFSINLDEINELLDTDEDLVEWLFTMESEKFGLIGGIANPTGIALIIILTIMVICSLPFVRKSGYFEVFYWTHLLYIAFFILTILHGPNFWKWFVAPGIIFVLERVIRTIKMRTGHGKTYISSGVLLPSKVIHLVIKRPLGFQFHPGDYVFVNIPTIAKYEWHPFTISSAPEQGDAVWLHIRAVGEWTNRLYGYFENEQLKCERQRGEFHGHSSVSIFMADGENVEVRMPSELHSSGRNTQLAIANETCTTEGAACSTDRTLDNGYTNEGFEHDTNTINPVDKDAAALPKNKLLANHKNQSAPSLVHNNVNGKKVLVKSQSVPDFERKVQRRKKNIMLNNFRPKSDQKFNQGTLSMALQAALADGTVEGPSRRELAKSFRYMRRKPKIITLDLPSESEGEDEDEEMPEDIGRDAVVSVEDGRRKSYAVSQEEQRQRRKSRQEERRVRKKSRMEEVIAEGGCAVGKPLVIYIDGPFGAPSSHIFRAQHAVLIGTGIGVTPFASILQSIMHKYWKARHTCPSCNYSWTSDVPHTVMNLRKVDFFWINRDQRSFEWFVNLLSQLEIEQAEHGGVMERFLDMHMYITSALQKTDMKAVGLQLALDLLHEKEKRDLITGLKTRTNAGRPNWDKVFKQLQNQQKGKITVFYCGPPALARTLRYKCDEYGFDFRKEIF